jgi:hypothetical protein
LPRGPGCPRVRPREWGFQLGCGALAEIQKNPSVADAPFRLLNIKATMKSTGKVLISPSGAVGLLLQG